MGLVAGENGLTRRVFALVLSFSFLFATSHAAVSTQTEQEKPPVTLPVLVLFTDGPSDLTHTYRIERGRLWYADTDSNLRNEFLKVLTEIQSRYLLTYYPDGVADEGWHELDVRLKGRKGDIHTRRGY
jgi:hypothetical protein